MYSYACRQMHNKMPAVRCTIQWLQTDVRKGWQPLDRLMNPEVFGRLYSKFWMQLISNVWRLMNYDICRQMYTNVILICLETDKLDCLQTEVTVYFWSLLVNFYWKWLQAWFSGWELGSPVPPLFPRLPDTVQGAVLAESGGEQEHWAGPCSWGDRHESEKGKMGERI